MAAVAAAAMAGLVLLAGPLSIAEAAGTWPRQPGTWIEQCAAITRSRLGNSFSFFEVHQGRLHLTALILSFSYACPQDHLRTAIARAANGRKLMTERRDQFVWPR